MAGCRDLYLWSPFPPAYSVGTARSDGRGSAPSDPPCWPWSASLGVLQSRSDSRSRLKEKKNTRIRRVVAVQVIILVILLKNLFLVALVSQVRATNVQPCLVSVLAAHFHSVPGCLFHCFQFIVTLHLSPFYPPFLSISLSKAGNHTTSLQECEEHYVAKSHFGIH